MSSFCPRTPHYIQSPCQASSGCSWLQPFRRPLFLRTLTVVATTCRYLVRCSSGGICLKFSSGLRWIFMQTTKVKHHAHHIISKVCIIDVTPLVDLYHVWLIMHLFLFYKVILAPVSSLYPLEGSHIACCHRVESDVYHLT